MIAVERFYQKSFIIGIALVIILPINIMVRLDDTATEINQTIIPESLEYKTTESISVEYSFSMPEIKEAGIYDSISIQGLRCYGEPGMPILPYKSAKILLPYAHELRDVDVRTGEEMRLNGTYFIEPGQTPLPPLLYCTSPYTAKPDDIPFLKTSSR